MKLVLVPHLSGEKSPTAGVFGCGDLAIPRRCIVKMTVLRKG